MEQYYITKRLTAYLIFFSNVKIVIEIICVCGRLDRTRDNVTDITEVTQSVSVNNFQCFWTIFYNLFYNVDLVWFSCYHRCFLFLDIFKILIFDCILDVWCLPDFIIFWVACLLTAWLFFSTLVFILFILILNFS